MALQKEFYRVNFGKGLDTKSDAKVLNAGQMTVLQNAQFTAVNRVSKRYGFAAVGSTNTNPETIQRLDNFNGNVVGWGNPGAAPAQSVHAQHQRRLQLPVHGQ